MNNETFKTLEFIQITASLYAKRCPLYAIIRLLSPDSYPLPAVRSTLLKIPSTPVENPRQISPFLQNKPNFRPFWPKNDERTKKQTQFCPRYELTFAFLSGIKPIKNLEFIRITCSSRGRAKSPRSRRQVKKDRRRSYYYVENVFGRQRRHRALQPAVVEWVVWIHSINKKSHRPLSSQPAYGYENQNYDKNLSI